MSKGAGKTGAQPTFLVAAERIYPRARRIVDDAWAYRMLSPAMKAFVSLMRFSGFHNWMVSASEKSIPGAWAGILIRKRYIDDRLLESLDSVQAIVNLGAGLDTRALRLEPLKPVSVWELDLRENIADKRARFEKALGAIPRNLCLVPIDFDTDSLESALVGGGFDPALRTFFIWEGVTQYLTQDGIESTLRFLSRAPTGSKLAFTYVLRDFIEGKNMLDCGQAYNQYVKKQKIWLWGRNPGEWPKLLEPYGWRMAEDRSAVELANAYITPTGRSLLTNELERMALAEKI